MMDIANEVIKMTYHKNYASELGIFNLRPADSLRAGIGVAKRFVLDASMSEFMAELATVPFAVAVERRGEVLSSIRHSARLPFKKMFIQFDGRAFRRGLLRSDKEMKDAFGNVLLGPDGDIVPTVGWLLEECRILRSSSSYDQNVMDTVMVSEYMDIEGKVKTLPFAWLYRWDDVGFKQTDMIDIRAGDFAHGLIGVKDPNIAIMYPGSIKSFDADQMLEVQEHTGERWPVNRLVPECGGVIRYVLCFLATLNDIPKTETLIAPQKRYYVSGQFRRPVAHTHLTLKLVGKRTARSLAKRLIAKVRRGHHEVRSHFRHLRMSEAQLTCAHIWGAADLTGHSTCSVCKARRVWVTLPNGRGDPANPVPEHSRYYVTR